MLKTRMKMPMAGRQFARRRRDLRERGWSPTQTRRRCATTQRRGCRLMWRFDRAYARDVEHDRPVPSVRPASTAGRVADRSRRSVTGPAMVDRGSSDDSAVERRRGLAADLRFEVLDRALAGDDRRDGVTHDLVVLRPVAGPQRALGGRLVLQRVDERLRCSRAARSRGTPLSASALWRLGMLAPSSLILAWVSAVVRSFTSWHASSGFSVVGVDDVGAPEQPVALAAARAGRQLDDVPAEVGLPHARPAWPSDR